MASKTRYATALLYFIVIGGTAAFIIWDQTSQLSPTSIPVMSIQWRVSDFILILLGASIPILFLEYYLFAIPIAMLFLFGNRIVRAASYEMNIMNIGSVFDGRHMIRRTAAPALFSIASSDMFRGQVAGYVFPNQTLVAGTIEYATVSLMGALLVMPLALLIFMPTWVLNDTGIVTHLKENKLAIRQCPDTQGVGRWVSNIFGGFALIAFPLTMFQNHVLPHILDGSLFDMGQNGAIILNAFLLILGLPLFVMAFILPVVMFNERSQVRIRTRMAAFATKLGSTIVRKERIEKAKRITQDGILTEEGGQVIVSTAKTMNIAKVDREVVTSRKAIQRKDKKEKPKKKSSSKKK